MRLKTLALRILGRHYPETLSDKEQEEFAGYMRRVHAQSEDDVLTDYQGKKRLTPQVALAEIVRIRSEKVLGEEDLRLLEDLETYLTAL